MASKTFLLLALAFAVVLLISSEVAANDLTNSDHDAKLDGHGGYYNRGHGGYGKGGGGGYGKGGGGGYGKGGGGGYGKGGGRGGGRGCRHGCCGGRYNRGGGCKCCSSFEEATAYKQTQN